jgi:hypothetical protein
LSGFFSHWIGRDGWEFFGEFVVFAEVANTVGEFDVRGDVKASPGDWDDVVDVGGFWVALVAPEAGFD